MNYFICRTVALHMIVCLAACDKPSSTPMELNPRGIKPDMEVVVASGSFGCEFENEFVKAAEHRKRSEYSAFFDIVFKAPWCFEQSRLLPEQKFTVFEIRGGVARIQARLIDPYGRGRDEWKYQEEFELKRHNHPYWTLAQWLIPASENPNSNKAEQQKKK